MLWLNAGRAVGQGYVAGGQLQLASRTLAAPARDVQYRCCLVFVSTSNRGRTSPWSA